MRPILTALSGLLGVVGAVALVLTGCGDSEPTALTAGNTTILAKAGNAAKKLSTSRCALDAGGFSINITNPFFPAPVGMQTIFAGEEDGEELTLQITVLNLTREIGGGGVTARVIEEREWVDGELKEVSWNYYVQAGDGTVCYLGEDVDIYEDGGISHDGRWCAATPGFAPGIQMPADPRPGMRFALEIAPGIAEDEAKIVGSGPTEVEFGRFTNTIRFRESNPLDGDKGYKVFANGMGLIVDGPAELHEVNQTAGTPQLPTITEQVCGL